MIAKDSMLEWLKSQIVRRNVTVKDDIAAVVARAQARRPVDILVNNAGGGVIGATEEMSDAEVEGQIALNLIPDWPIFQIGPNTGCLCLGTW